MLQYIIPLIVSYLPMFHHYLWYVVGIAALCWIPCFIRSFFWR